MIVEDFNEEKKEEYFAFIYKEKDGNMDRNKGVKMVRLDENSDMDEYKVRSRDEKIFFMPSTDKRFPDRIVVVASSGSGKSVLINQYAFVFHNLNPRMKIFYITANDFRADKNLTHSMYKYIPLDTFMEACQNEDISTTDMFTDSLLIFDDVDSWKDKKKILELWKIIFAILNNLRKKNVAVVITLHCSKVPNNMTRDLAEEARKYIVFPKENQTIGSDRILNSYLGLKKTHLKEILNSQDRFCCDDIKRKVLITPTLIKRLRF